MRRSLIALLLLLAGCTTPPPEAFVASAREEMRAAPAGTDLQGQPCLRRGSEIYCGGWSQPAARLVELDGATDPARLAALATGGSWRAGLDARLACGAPETTTLAGGRPALLLACTRRTGGWPHLALVTTGPRGPVLADGLPASLPAIETTILGTATGRADRSASLQLAIARLSAERFGTAEVARYEALLTLGAELNQSENFAAATDAYRTALAIQERTLGAGHPDTVTALLHLALNHSNLGREAESAPLFARAERLAPRATDPVSPARLAHYRGLDAANRGDVAAAARFLESAEAGYAALVPRDLLGPRGPTLADAVAPSLSLDVIGQSALLGLIEVRRNRAVMLSRLGRNEEAAQMVGEARRLAARAGLSDNVTLGRGLRSEGAVRERLGTGAQPLYAEAALRFGAALPAERPEAVTLFLSGGQLAAAGRRDAALAEFRRGAEILRARQLGLPVPLLQPYLDLLADGGAAAELFAALQLARRDGTARLVAQASARLAAGAADPRVAGALRGMQDADRTLRALLAEREEPGRANDAALAERIAETRRARDAAEEEAAAAAPGYRQLLLGTAEAPEAAAALRPEEALFVMLAGPERTHVVALRRDGRMAAHRVPLGEAALAALVERVRAGLVTGGAPRPFDAQAAHALHAALVAPLMPVLEGAGALVVVADGPLLRLPFAVLLERPEQGAEAPWLVRRFALSHMPSIQALVTLRRGSPGSAAPRPYLGFGDPVAPEARLLRAAFPPESCAQDARLAALLPPLPATRAEVSVAARMMRAGPADTRLGRDFTPAGVRAADPGRHRVLHFATHTLLPGDLSCLREPALLASAPAGAADARAALLTASDILEMRLDADLVILSACNTAVGPGGGDLAGEGLAGLARSFFYAGTRGVLATHWAVDDLASAVTIADLLSRMERSGAGGAAALREAQLLLMRDAGGRFPPEFAHPAWWAAFAMIGDGRRAPAQLAAR
jgi:CHAT domain-containing protein